jgi:MtN3 and saliva related transmembrane protein
MLIDAIGYSAAVFTTASILPQLFKTIRTKSADDVSIWMFIVYFIGDSLWFSYGFLLHSVPMMLSNGTALLVIGLNIYFTNKYTKKLAKVT